MAVKVIRATRTPTRLAPEMEQKKLRVAAYARVSTDTDEQEGSYEAQVNHYTTLIQNNPDWEFAGMFADMKTPSLIQFNDLRRLAGRGGVS